MTESDGSREFILIIDMIRTFEAVDFIKEISNIKMSCMV